MPKATLEFTLPEETQEFRMASHGLDYAIAWADLCEKIRRCLKYETISPIAYETLVDVQQKMISLQDSYHLPEPE